MLPSTHRCSHPPLKNVFRCFPAFGSFLLENRFEAQHLFSLSIEVRQFLVHNVSHQEGNQCRDQHSRPFWKSHTCDWCWVCRLKFEELKDLNSTGNAGIGRVVCKSLVKHDPGHIYIAARNPKAAESAIAEIKSPAPKVDVTWLGVISHRLPLLKRLLE